MPYSLMFMIHPSCLIGVIIASPSTFHVCKTKMHQNHEPNCGTIDLYPWTQKVVHEIFLSCDTVAFPPKMSLVSVSFSRSLSLSRQLYILCVSFYIVWFVWASNWPLPCIVLIDFYMAFKFHTKRIPDDTFQSRSSSFTLVGWASMWFPCHSHKS